MGREASALMKEWRNADIKRLRNLQAGKYTDGTTTQTGYDKQKIIRSEGEEFEEDGKKYKIVNGIKRRQSLLSALREEVKIPLFCPCCSRSLAKEIDQKMYKISKTCFDCNLEFEAQLKREGKFRDYQDTFQKENLRAELIDFREYLINYVENQTLIINSEGEAEEWDRIKVDITETLKTLDQQIADI